MTSPLRRRVLALLLLALPLAAPAAAHTRLSGSSPAADDTARTPVREIRLRFSQAPEASMTWLAVLRGGDTLAAGVPVAVAASGGREFALTLAAPLRDGAYRVSWRTAGADGHVLRGAFGFTVVLPLVAALPAADPVDAADPVEVGEVVPEEGGTAAAGVAVRWAGFAGLLGMVGAAVFYVGVLDRMRRRGLHPRVTARAAYGAWHVAAGAAALSLLAMVLRLWLQSAEVYGAAEALEGARLASLLRTTTWGAAWTLQAIATTGFFLGLLVARLPHGRGAGWMGAAVAAALLCAVPALSGHAAAVEGRAGAWAIVADGLHVLGAGAWLGTLALLLAAGLPAALSTADGGGPGALADLVDTFSPVALGAGVLAGATGVVSALFHLNVPDQLWTTGYGRALALKLLLVGAVAAAGAYNWRRVRPRLSAGTGSGRLRRTATVELLAGALVVLVTAFLVALPTP